MSDPMQQDGAHTGEIINDNGDGGVTDVAGDQAAEALLAGRVPELQADSAVLQVHGL